MRSKLLLLLLLVSNAAAGAEAMAQNPQRDTAAALPDTLRGMRAGLDPVTVVGRADTSGLAVRAGASVVIDASAIVAEAPVASLVELVQARVPGVSVFQAPGVPGAAAQIRIRGVHSVLGDGALSVYVDGVPVDAEAVSLLGTGNLLRAGIAGLAPEDAESVEVLKGPASTLWQGPAAAGGAILITTRKANPGGRGLTQRIVLEHGPVDPGAELPANWVRCGDDPVGACAGQPADMILSDRPLERNGVLDGGTATTIHWSGHGSTDRFGVYGSLGWTRDDGVLPTTGFDRRSARVGLRMEAAETVDLEVELSATDVELDLPESGFAFGNLVSLALGGSPVTVGGAEDGWSVPDATSVLDVDQTVDARRYRPRVQLVHRATPWLTHSLLAGADLARDEGRRRDPRIPDAAMLTRADRDVDLYTVDYRARVDGRRLGDGRHDLALLLGAQATWDRRVTSVRSGREGEPGEIDPTQPYSGEETRWEREAVGIVADARYGFRDRLFTELGVRHDWLDDVDDDAGRLLSYRAAATLLAYEAAGPDAPLPGVGAVRLRAALGATERDSFLPVGMEPMLDPYAELFVRRPGVKERWKEAEVGIGATFLDDRVGLGVTAFRRTSRDVAVPAQAPPPSTGYFWTWNGRAEIRNDGVEAVLAAELLRMRTIAWSARLGITRLTNKVVAMSAAPMMLGGWQRLEEGNPVGVFYAPGIVDIDEAAGQVLVTDGFEHAGNPVPEWEGMLDTDVSLRGWLRIRALLDARAGFEVFNAAAMWRDRGYRNSERYARRDALPADERTLYFGEYVNSSGALPPMGVAAPYIQDGDFVRLREVSATVDLPRAWVARVGASGASFTVAGRNVALWSRYDGVEPEFTGWTAPFDRSDWFNLPQTARWTARLAVTF